MSSEPSVGEQWKDTLNEDSNAYSGYTFTPFEYFKFNRSFINRKIRNICNPSNNMKVLEAGCGSGKMSTYLATKGCDVHSVDISQRMLENLQLLVKNTEKHFGPLKVHTQIEDITKMSYKDNTFDFVINEGVVEHWLDKKERVDVIQEMTRVTKKGGYVVIIVPNGAHPFTKRWLKNFSGYLAAPPMTLYSTKKLQREMEACGLRVIETDGAGPWRSLNLEPDFGSLPRHALMALDFVFPMTKTLRKIWGVNIFAIGIKK